jgi:hypothetical protein
MTRTVQTLLALVCLVGCGSAPTGKAAAAPGGSKDQSSWPADDRTLCDWRTKPELEVAETAGPGALRPNVRRVFKFTGDKEARHKVLVCREIDTNLDGIKDVVRTFNAKGEAVHEEADTNYDGKIDIWADFVSGRLAREEDDTNYDGKADVWKFYLDGQLSRIRRNTHCPNGKPDTWEIYNRGRLERIGNDTSCDGHVDRWDRDGERLAAEEEQSRKTEEAMQKKAQEDAVTFTDGGAPDAKK